MARVITVGAAQSGPIPRSESRSDVLQRLLSQLREAHRRGCDLVVFTECALTPFFPHWWTDDEAELSSWFETELPGPNTQPLFDEARRLGIGFSLGFAELAIEDGITRRFNSSVLVEKDGSIVGKFRKIHLPGHTEHRPDNPFQNL
ncbi:MAG: N-carbamoyl-D-amino-acid hydrolase, partial [Planctomycetota bacterium]|nr:N-carbamoyl-D-amino-acid hydrolase [Planctomycetota bacterium]